LAGAVWEDGQPPADLVQDGVVVKPAAIFEVGEAGATAVGQVLHVVRFTAGAGWSQPPGNWHV
jgi:hypothetical protein